MAWSKVRRFSREELIAELQREVAVRGDVTFREFQRAIGRSGAVLDGLFANWGELRLAAGLGSRRPAAMRLISDEALIAEYRRVCELLRRTPDDREFGTLASCSMITLRKRFGDGSAIRRAVSGWSDGRVEQARAPHPGPLPGGKVEDTEKSGCGGEGEARCREARSWVVEWLSEEWKQVRAGLAWRSSFVVTAPRDAFDVVFCAEHDWPECPWPVIEWRGAVRNRVVPGVVCSPDGTSLGVKSESGAVRRA